MPVPTKRDTPVKPTPDMWLHVGETSLLAAGLAVVAVILAHATHIHYWAVSLIEALLAAAIVCSALVATSSASIAFFLSTWGVLIPAWTLAAGLAGVWNHYVIGTLICAWMFLLPRGAYIFAREHAHHQKQIEGRALETANQDKVGWQRTLARMDAPGVVVEEIVTTRAGEDVFLTLPAKGNVTFESLRETGHRIEISRRLKRGAIRFSEGEESHQVVMHVTKREVLKETIDYALDWLDRPIDRTVNDPFEVGLYENGEPALIKFREIAGLVLGVRRSGKSNFMNVFIAELSRCVDVVIFMIDMKGGQAASAWLQPWVEGECDRPVLDWVATDRDEAKIMLDTLLMWIDLRSRKNVGREKIKPSTRQPAIVLIIDELSELTGMNSGKVQDGQATNTQLAGLLERFVSLGGSTAIDLLGGTQRGTVTKIGNGDLKSQCELRVGLGAVSQSDASYIFKDHRAAQLLTRISRIPGAALIELGDTSAPLKVKRLDPDRGDIRRIAAHAGDYRPKLEPALTAAAGSAYEDRWKRPGQQEYIHQIRTNTLPANVDEEFWDLADRMNTSEGGGPGPTRINPARQLMRDLIVQSGMMGETPYGLGKKLEAADQKVSQRIIQEWLKQDVTSGMFVSIHPNTPKVRYLSREKGRQMGATDDATGTDG